MLKVEAYHPKTGHVAAVSCFHERWTADEKVAKLHRAGYIVTVTGKERGGRTFTNRIAEDGIVRAVKA